MKMNPRQASNQREYRISPQSLFWGIFMPRKVLSREGLRGLVLSCKKFLLRYGIIICVIVFASNLLWNGFAINPNLNQILKAVQTPYASVGERNYIQGSPFFFYLAFILRANTACKYILLCMAICLILYVLLYKLPQKVSRELGILAFLLFLAHPMSYILHSWFGMVDCLTVLCTLVILFTHSWLAIFFLSAIAITNHPSALFIVPAILALRYLSKTQIISKSHFVSAILGLAIGKLLIRIVFHLTGFVPYSRAQYILDIPFSHWLTINSKNFTLIWYSFAFAVWIPILLMLICYFKKNRLFYSFYIACMMFFYGITFFSQDTTRVFALLSWAPTMYCLLHTWKLSKGEQTRVAIWYRFSVFFAVSLGWLFPHFSIWAGGIYAPQFLPARQGWCLMSLLGIGN